MQWGPRRIDFQLHPGEETGVAKMVKRRQEAGLPMCIGSMTSGTRPVEWPCPFPGIAVVFVQLVSSVGSRSTWYALSCGTSLSSQRSSVS